MKRLLVSPIGLGLLVLPALATAQPATPVQPVSAPSIGVTPGEGYRLGVNDEVEVTIFGRENQVIRTRVKEDGTVTVPLIGSIPARDRTARQLAADIGNQLRAGGYLVNPVVNVDVTQFVSNAVTVLGSVNTPGIYPLDRPQTVAMAVARAGGTRADGADYALLRRSAGDEHQIPFNSIGGEWNGATPLLPGDTVMVPPAPKVYVYGQVNSPGSFPVTTGMTVRQALAQAGGPTLAGTTRKVTLYRNGKKIRSVDLEETVQAEDTFKVGERLF